MSMEEETKTPIIHLCGKCKEELKNVGSGFDISSFLDPVVQRYCPNNQCSRYGVVTVAFL